MAGSSPREAYRSYRNLLKDAIGCVTDAVLLVSEKERDFVLDQDYALTLQDGDPVSLAGESRIAVSITQYFRLARDEREDRGPFRVSTSAYYYTIEEQDGPEILAYHWHPKGLSNEAAPHLHLKSGAKVGRAELTRTKGQSAHIPTGRVALEEVLRLLIEGFNVPPKKEGWEGVLTHTKGKFDQYKNW